MAYIGPEPNPGQNREVDDISSSFNGSTTAFTLQVNSQNVSPGSSNAIIVSLGGVVQNPGTDYTIASSTITFTTAPASGLSFFGLVLGQGVDTGVPSDGSVTLAKFVNGTSSNNGKFLRANNGAAPSFETVTGTTINNNADNRVITGSGTANTLEGEANLTYTGANFGINDSSPSFELVVKADDANQSEIQILAGGNGKESNLLFGAPDDDDVGSIKYDHNGDHMKFTVGTSEIFRANSNGICIGGTGAANGLDDYEEGTHNPTMTGSSSTTSFDLHNGENTITYVKIGQNCFLTGRIRINNANYAGGARMSLPFAAAAGTGCSNCGQSCVATHGVNFENDGVGTGHNMGLFIETFANTSLALFVISRDDAGWINAESSHIGSNDYLAFNMHYQTT